MTPNPFLTIWLSPRETIRRIVEWNPNYWVIALGCLLGVAQVSDPSMLRVFGGNLSPAVIYAIVLVVGPLAGLVQLGIWSLLTCWTGRWLGGTASVRQIAAAVAWSYIPIVVTIPLPVLACLIAGLDLFAKPPAHLDTPLSSGLLYAVVQVVEIALGIWSFVISCHTVAEVQGYRSAWRGLGNVMLPVALVMAVLVVFAFIAIAIAVGLSSHSPPPRV